MCVLGYFGYFGCVMGNGITHCFRRARGRRQESRRRRREHREQQWLTKVTGKRLRMENANEREQEKRRRKELQDWEKTQKRVRRLQNPPVTAPETAHVRPSSSINVNGSHRPTHGSSARIAGTDSLFSKPAEHFSGTRSQINAWNVDVERGLAPDNRSLKTDTSSEGRIRLQKRNRSRSVTSRSQPLAYIRDDVSICSSATAQRRARLQKQNGNRSIGALSQQRGGNLSPLSRRSEDHHMGSVGSSSLLFDDRGSVDQRSISALGLLSERR